MPRLLALVLALAAGGGALALTGCTPHIGDHCNLNTDCSIQGTKVCDNAQPNGYCTSFNCAPNSCLDNAVCVMLYPAPPGCPYDGYQSPSRTGRTMCLAHCSQDSDCRVSEGYACRPPGEAPWNAIIMDDNQNQMVCVALPIYEGGIPDAGDGGDGAVAPVCSANGPTVPVIDAGAPHAIGAE